MSIKARLLAVLALILIVFSGAATVTLFNLNLAAPKLEATEVAARRVSEESIPLLIVIKDIKMDVVQVQQWISDISATRGQDGLNDGFDEAKANADRFYLDLAKARELATGLNLDESLAALAEVEKAFPPYYETGVKMGQTYVAQGPAGGNQMMSSFDAVAEKIGETLDNLIEIVGQATEQRLTELQTMSGDVKDANANISQLNMILTGVGLVISLAGAIYLFTLIRGSITGLLADLDLISQQNYTAKRSLSTGRTDEFGAVAVALAGTCEKLQAVEALEAQQRADAAKSSDERRSERLRMAEQFESSVGSVVSAVSSASTEMRSSAESVAQTADVTSKQSTVVAAVSEEASTNVQTVASAAEELSSSISEISRQVATSTQISSQAVAEVEGANAKVRGLANAANKIGEVVALITDIADQTNLLALNATIEAARAGDAGKGFAVVASEVKNLANQTARATEEISAQIGGIQGATKEAVDAIESIGNIINQMSEISSTIAAAVEEQGAATQESARNIEQAAAGTNEVASTIQQVNEAAGETGASAGQMMEAARELSQQSETLRNEVSKFLNQIRSG